MKITFDEMIQSLKEQMCTFDIIAALELAVEQRNFWHEKFLESKGTPNDGGEQRSEDDYQIMLILKGEDHEYSRR